MASKPIQGYVFEGLGVMSGPFGQLRDIFFHFGAIWGSFGCHFMFDFSLQTLTVMQLQVFPKAFKIFGFYNGFCTLSHIVMF